MVSIGSIVAKFQLNIDNFTANMKKAEDRIKKLEDKFSGYDTIGDKFTSLGTKLTVGLTAPIGGAITAATNLAATFEEKLSKVEAISGATGDEMLQLKDKAMEMGAKTKFSAGESADAMTYMAMAGWKTTDMIEGLEGIMNLAAADGLDLATTSDIVTDSLTAFGLSAKDSAKFADVLAMASSASNTSVQMLGESFKYVAPVAGALGYTVEDTSVALGLMANAGIKAGQAGTSLRSAMTRLIKPTDDAAMLMDQYGISMTNSDGSMKSLSEVMVILRDKMGSLTEAEQAQAATTIFGQEAMSGMLAVINASDSDFATLTNAINNADGTAKSMAETMQDNLKGSIEQMMGALETLGIKIGDLIIPKITEIVEKVTGWIEKFTELDEGSQRFILTLAGIVAAIGPTLAIIGTSIKMFGKMQANIALIKGAFSALAHSQTLAAAKTALLTAAQTALNFVMSLNPAVWVVAGIMALIGVFVLLWNKCDAFREFWLNLWEVLKEKVSSFWEWLTGIFSNVWESVKAGWESFKTGFIELWQSVSDWFTTLWESIKLLIQQAVDGILQVWSYFSESVSMIFEGITLYFSGWWEVIKNIFMGFLLIIIDLVTLDFENLKSDIANIWENIKAGFSQVWEGITMIFQGTLEFIKTYVALVFTTIWNKIVLIWTNVKNFFINLWTDVSTTISQAWENFKKIIVEKCISIKNSVVEWFTNTLTWLKELPGKLYTIGSDMFIKMKNGVINTVSGVYDSIVNGVTQAINWLKDLPAQAVTWGKHMIQGFIDGITGMVGSLIEKVKGVGESIRDFLGFSIPKKGPLHVYMEWMPHMIQGMTKSLEQESPLLLDAASDVAGSLSGAMSAKPVVEAAGTTSTSGIEVLTEAVKELVDKVSRPVAVFELNGRKFAEATAEDMSKALAERTR